MKRKKQGASLIVVIIIFMFISTVSMAMLSTVAGNYKARVVESKRVENLYASNSGLDVAYNIIGKTFDAATQYGYLKAKRIESLTKDSTDDRTSVYNQKYINLKKDIYKWQTCSDETISQKVINENIENDNKQIEDIINEEFKRTFKNFILSGQDEKKGDNEKVPGKSLYDYIEKNEYVDSVKGINNTVEDYEIATVKFSENNTPELWIPKIGTMNPDGKDETSNGIIFDPDKDNSEKYKITVKSRFKTLAGNINTIGENSRIVQATYVMSVPNYKDIYYQQISGDLHEYRALKDRALTIGGDMNVGDEYTFNTNLTINKGDVFVQGKLYNTINEGNPDNSSKDRVYGKYGDGITLKNIEKVLFDKNVITRGTFKIQKNVGTITNPATIIGNLYAKNIYAGTADGKGYTDKGYLNVNGEVVIDNDLTLKATNTNITIKDFYGINDKNIKYEDDVNNNIENSDSNPNDISRTSSSIVINDTGLGEQGSSINITNSAYIMGTAHIATTGNYQTGESTAVKGNYEAYSVPGDDPCETFIYDDPLQLLNETNIFKKATHFVNYWNGKDGIDTGGIYLPKGNIHSVGAIVYKYKDETNKEIVEKTIPNYTPELESSTGKITEKRNQYASEVYKFGQSADYNSSEINAIKVEDLTNFSNLNSDYDSKNTTGKIIRVIKGKNASRETYDPDKYEVIDKSNETYVDPKYLMNGDVIVDGDVTFYGNTSNFEGTIIAKGNLTFFGNVIDFKGVIITSGNLTFTGNVTFNGSIIANGDFTVTGNSTITYDEDVIQKVQTQNIELFENVFGNSVIADTTPISNTNSIEANYDLKNFLESKLWKIIK